MTRTAQSMMNSATIKPPRCNVLGIGVHAVNMESAVQEIQGAVRRGEKGYVCVTGVHGVMEAQKDSGLREAFNQSFLTVPDGMPMVWVGRLQGHRTMRRVYGPDLMIELCKSSIQDGATHYLYGGKPGTAEDLKQSLEKLVPGVRIVGTSTPPFRPLHAEEERELAEEISRLQPDYFWVGISSPKQDRFMAHYRSRLDAGIMLGVGAAFDVHTGGIKDAPSWMKQAGLQWLHRLGQEPRRL